MAGRLSGSRGGIPAMTKPEQRLESGVLAFDEVQSHYIDWNKVAEQARREGSHFDVRFDDDGWTRVKFFWSVADGE
jgi:hypothetical protein